jgi:sec-independent protein translocase protein TatA
MRLGPTELLIILVIVVFLFGGKKIPEFIKSIGEALREFRKASKEKTEE